MPKKRVMFFVCTFYVFFILIDNYYIRIYLNIILNDKVKYVLVIRFSEI